MDYFSFIYINFSQRIDVSSIYLLIVSILGWGIGSFFYKGANNNIHPIMVSSIATCVYAIITPTYFIFLQFDRSVNTTGVIYALLGGLFMCVGSMAYFYALRAGAAGQVTSITALYPTLTLILSCMFMGESLTFKKFIGVIFAVAAAFFLSLK